VKKVAPSANKIRNDSVPSYQGQNPDLDSLELVFVEWVEVFNPIFITEFC
jgi:hypothetical protein